METGRITTFTLLVATGAVAALEAIAVIFIRLSHFSPITITCIARIIQAIMILFLSFSIGGGLYVIGLDIKQWHRGIKRGLIWSSYFALVTLIFFIALWLLEIDPVSLIRVDIPSSTIEALIFFIAGGLAGPVAEELFFRGVIYGFLRRWGFILAVLISTVVFVIAHFHITGIPIIQFVGGLLFAIAYEIEKDILVPITIHVLGNLAIFSLSLF